MRRVRRGHEFGGVAIATGALQNFVRRSTVTYQALEQLPKAPSNMSCRWDRLIYRSSEFAKGTGMRREAATLVFLSIFMCCSAASQDSDSPASGVPPDHRVSLVSLLAVPERYDGQEIRTEGVAYISEIGGSALFLSLEHAQNRILFNGVRLDLEGPAANPASLNELHLKYVLVNGTFSAPHPGYELRGTITDVTMAFLSTNVEPATPLRRSDDKESE
jgi:hypothetical protein